MTKDEEYVIEQEYRVGVKKPKFYHVNGMHILMRRGRLYVTPVGQERSKVRLYLRSGEKRAFRAEELLGVVADHIRRQYRPPEHWKVVRGPDVPLSREELENVWLRDRRTCEVSIRPEDRKRLEDFAYAAQEAQPDDDNSNLGQIYKKVVAYHAKQNRPTITFPSNKLSIDDLAKTTDIPQTLFDGEMHHEPIDNSQRIGNLFNIDEDEVEDEARILVH